MKVRIARAAINDLVEIERHISRDNPAAARRQVAALFDRCHSLAHNPMRYPTTPITGLRRRPHRSYLISIASRATLRSSASFTPRATGPTCWRRTTTEPCS
ncbi:type II toxin-antitoxin system RelE/ParE family toxin [uncultured Brevundimonas sp.]|uniref:type II toxin-antitoxin system RelE/ParE family toxin n=1 Tax=uncultured Brevundimonas sp. TaxID=213418 RepID=UPI00341EE98C